MEPKLLRYRATVEVTCETEEGIDAIRDALDEGLRASKDTSKALEALEAELEKAKEKDDLDECIRINDEIQKLKEGCQIKIHLVAHPVFALLCLSRDKELSIALLTEAADRIKESIESKGGHFFLRSVPDLQGYEKEHEYPGNALEGAHWDDGFGSEDLEEDVSLDAERVAADDVEEVSRRRVVNFVVTEVES